MTVLVCVPYYRTPEYVERAVRSVLAQTYTDLVCVVIGDGEEPPLSAVRDSRLVVHSYPTNRGAYFAQDVAIWASPFEWYAIVASDDWVTPDHLERLLAYGDDRCAGGLLYHNDRHCPDPAHLDCPGSPIPVDFAKSARKPYEVGVYRTERYREVGAHNPAERLGQDTLTLRVMRLVAPVGVSDHLTYHRLGRPGSLCTDPATNRDSPARRAMKRRNHQIIRQCERLWRRGAGVPDRAPTAGAIRRYRESLVPAEVQDALAREVDRLTANLAQAAAA